MAHTSVKISANSSDYQSQMKSAASQMKVLSSEFKLAQTQPENGQNGANSEQENGQQTSGDGDDAAGQETSGDDERKTEEQVSDSDTIYPEKTTRAIVDCDGALNLRRSASWGNESICGRAVRGQSYYIKAIHTVEGKKMLETIDGIFLSGQPEHVRIIEV